MRRPRKVSLEELVNENKKGILSDKEALEKIEKKLEEKHSKNL